MLTPGQAVLALTRQRQGFGGVVTGQPLSYVPLTAKLGSGPWIFRTRGLISRLSCRGQCGDGSLITAGSPALEALSVGCRVEDSVETDL